MAATFKRIFRQDLTKPLQIYYNLELVFSKDNLANEIQIELYNGSDVYSGGGSVSGTAIRADGRTIPLENGTISGNVVTVALTEACMEIPGTLQVYVKLTSGDVKTTIFAGVFTAIRTETNAIIDPGTIIPSITELINQIDAAIDSIPADYSTLLGSVAGTYSASKTYAVGDYVWYDGALYRCSTAITTAEAWTAAHWTSAVISDDVTSLSSALNAKVDSVDIYGGEVNLTPMSVMEGKTVNYTNTGSTISIGNNSSRDVVQYAVSTLRGKTLTVYNYNDSATRNYYTDEDGKVVSELTAGTSERTSTVPNTAVYLYLTHNKSQSSAYVKHIVTDCLEKDIDDADDALQEQIDGIEGVMVTHDEIYAHGESITPSETIDGKWIGVTSAGSTPVLNNNSGQEVVVFDVEAIIGKKTEICNYNYNSRNYWCDSRGKVITSLASGNGARIVYPPNGVKYLYVSNTKASGSAYVKKIVADTIGNNAMQGAFRLENMILNPSFEDATGWNGITSVAGGIATVSTTTTNPQIRQQKHSLQFSENDVLYCRVVVDEITNIKANYFTIDGATSVDSGSFSFVDIFNGHDLLERSYPCSVSCVVNAPAPKSNGDANRFLANFTRVDADVGSSIKLHGVACINLTKAFGAGYEPNRSTMDMLLDGMDADTFEDSINVTKAEYLINGAEYMPKNGAGFSVNPLGYCEFRSIINPNWSGWQNYWNTYGRSYGRCPIPNQVHGDVETDAMFVVTPKFGRWSGWCNGNHVYGGHVFEAWTIDHYNRLTFIIGKTHKDEANIIVYHPNDPEGDPAAFGAVRIGADEDGMGFVFMRQQLEAYGNLVFSGTFGPVLKSANGKRWRIKVDNSGNLSTEEVNLTMRDETVT